MPKQRNRTYEAIGDFLVTSPEIRVSDPGYDKDVWCCGVLKNMREGRYEAYVAYCDDRVWGHRVEMLLIKHENSTEKPCLANTVFSTKTKIIWGGGWEPAEIDVGVDSGQAGFFDELMYQHPFSVLSNQALVRKLESEHDALIAAGRIEDARAIKDKLQQQLDQLPDEYGGSWYTACCRLTLSKQMAGVIPYGAVSSSGVGDGRYDCFVRRESNGEGVMACLLYM